MKGRKPKPTSIHILNGNPGKRRIKEPEIESPRGIPPPPDHLSREAKAAWPYLAARLDEMGVMTYADAWALEQLAENYAEILAWRKEIKQHGRMTSKIMQNGEERDCINPACLALSDSEKRFRAMMAEFGLTPS